MRILLIGEYSNVHHTLAMGLRAIGHEVTVASDGDRWKDYPRDVDLKRRSMGRCASLCYYLRIWWKFRKFRGFDVVQLINPEFLSLKAERIRPFYRYLRRHNRRVVMGAFGMDYYYVKACLDLQTFRYSDFNIGEQERVSEMNANFKADWLHGPKAELTRQTAADCDAIVAGLYEYYVSYRRHYTGNARLEFIPFPIVTHDETAGNPDEKASRRDPKAPAQILIGIQSRRSVYKGTDVMWRAARRLAADYPDDCRLTVVSDLPFSEYVRRMEGAEIILDQLYSYTPAMNALQAMAQGLICVGGGEPENYEIIHENELRPIVNVLPDEQDVYEKLRDLVLNRAARIPELQAQSREYVRRHHDYLKVARQYEALYKSLL